MKPDRFLLKVWRWHFYAGLFTLPILFVLALSGLVYLFRDDIEDRLYADRIFAASGAVAPAVGRVPLETQLALVREAHPGARVATVRPPAASGRSTAFTFEPAGGEASAGGPFTVFVDPADGRILGRREEGSRPSALALELHGELFAGKTGDLVMELAASWAIMLVASGLYLWFPRAGREKTRLLARFGGGVLWPRLRGAASRTRWRDLHAVSGFWVSGVLAFFAFTGLFWSGVWGERIAKPWNTFPARMWNDVPLSGASTGTLNSASEKVVSWAAEEVPMPVSVAAGVVPSDAGAGGAPESAAGSEGHGHHGDHGALDQGNMGGAGERATVSLDAVQALADAGGLIAPRTISMPRGETGVFTVSAQAADPRDEALLHVDRYSGEALADVRYADYSPAAKAVASSIALHEGRYFGVWNKALAALACLLVIALCVGAVALWWRRRPRFSNLRAPSRVTLPAAWKGATVLLCLFGIAFPVAGVSLAAVLSIDALVFGRKRVRG